MADDHDRLEAELLEEGEQDLRLAVYPEALEVRRARALSEPEEVRRDDEVARAEPLHDLCPGVSRSWNAVQEEHSRTLSLHGGAQLQPADVHLDRLGHGYPPAA